MNRSQEVEAEVGAEVEVGAAEAEVEAAAAAAAVAAAAVAAAAAEEEPEGQVGPVEPAVLEVTFISLLFGAHPCSHNGPFCRQHPCDLSSLSFPDGIYANFAAASQAEEGVVAEEAAVEEVEAEAEVAVVSLRREVSVLDAVLLQRPQHTTDYAS